MSDAPRLRFAPSPTGMFHIGSGRSALYNWLYARGQGGTFILRVEDTDEARNETQWYELIYDSMRWLGLEWDEGPYLQSESKAKHSAAAQTLYTTGAAYYCSCSQEEVKERTAANKTPGYDGFCRDRGLGPEGNALRFRVPEGKTVVTDLIRGEVTFDNANIEDFITVRSSGVPMYLLANAVDDMNERITHVVRGEEHLNNTPKQMLIWKALDGGATPTYAHLPLIVNEKRQKISKRRDKVSLTMFREEGYLPEAMRNYLALLGWAPKGDREIIPIEEMQQEFKLEDVNKSGAFFDLKKLNHINGEYIRALDVHEFMERATPFLTVAAENGMWQADRFDIKKWTEIASLVQSRVDRLDEIAPMIQFLFIDEPEFAEDAFKGINDAAKAVLAECVSAYETADWNAFALHDLTQKIGEANDLKLGKAQAPIRVGVTGKRVGPPLFESLELLGREVSIARLKRLQTTLS